MEREKKKNRDKKQKGSRGAVTIFLVLVLVPCIIIACVFGDISRVELSKAEAAGAADLSMYSLLAHYDENLKEYYGLVASCQDIDSFFDTTEKYFTGMMRTAGVSGEGSELFSAYLDSLRGGDISDFLQVEFVEPAEVKALDNSDMGNNAALLEDGIVEFMKYRGPIEFVNGLLERLKKTNAENVLEDAKKDEPIVEEKKEYAEAQGEILKETYHCYLAIRYYADARDSMGIPSLEKYREYEQDLKKIARDFAKVTDLITKYYAATDGIHRVSFPSLALNNYVNKPGYKKEDVGNKVTREVPVMETNGALDIDITTGVTREAEPEEPAEPQTRTEEKYCINNTLLGNLLQDTDTYIRYIKDSADAIAGDCGNMGDPTPAGSDVNPAIYCMHVQNAATSARLQTIQENGEKLIRKYARLNAALSLEPYPEGDDLPYDWKTQISSAMSKIEESYRSYFSSNPSSAYGTIVSRYRFLDETRGTINSVQNRLYEFQSEYMGCGATIGQFTKEVREKFAQIEKDVNDQFARLNTAIYGGNFSYNGGNYHSISLDQLKSLAAKCEKERNEWVAAIESSGSTSDYADREKAEYQGEGDKSTKMTKLLAENNGKALEDLKTRLMNIRQDMKDFLDALKNFTYGGRKAAALDGREDVVQAGKTIIPTQFGQIDLSLAADERAASGYNNSLLKPSADQVYKAPALQPGPTGNHPALQEDPPELYYQLRLYFADDSKTIDNEIQKNEENKKRHEDEAKKKEDDSKSVNADYLKGKGGNLEGGSHGGSGVNALDSIGSVIDIVKNLLNGSGDNLRDQLYVAEYIMDMFSYSSFNNEGQHRLVHENGGPIYTLKDFKDKGSSYGKDTEWNAENKTEIMENQSLTNQPINASHNQMNLGEVEYILYGNTNLDENLKTAYGNIFAIRMILNVISGFQNFYSPVNDTGNAINAAAVGIMTATCGVVPEALTKCVLIGVLATMETAHDLERLKAGTMVALYKGADSWYYRVSSVSGDKDADFGEGSEPAEEGLYYSDYLYFFLMLGVTGGKYSSIVLRTGDLIQANMKKMGVKEFDLGKAKCFFKLGAKIKVKPLMIDLPVMNAMPEVDPGELENTADWCTYSVSFTRGYS